MIGPDGNVHMLTSTTLTGAEAEMKAHLDYVNGSILAYGTEDDIRAIGHRVKLGAKELEERAARRKQQRESRRRNR